MRKYLWNSKYCITPLLAYSFSALMMIIVCRYGMNYSPFGTISPDGIRFMHFWQQNIDHYLAESFSPIGVIKAVFKSLKESSAYDLDRGRIVQYLFYGLEVLLRGFSTVVLPNLIFALVMVINSVLIARVSTLTLKMSTSKTIISCMIAVSIMATSYSVSPIILNVLYGKYIWMTFIFLFLILETRSVKILMLVFAAYSDELGLFSAMTLLAIFGMKAYIASVQSSFHNGYQSTRIFLKSIGVGIIIGVLVLLVFYGSLAVIFNSGATGFRSFSVKGIKELAGPTPWDSVMGIAWRSQAMVIGITSKFTALTYLGFFIMGIIVVNTILGINKFYTTTKTEKRRLLSMLYSILNDRNSVRNLFLLFMLCIISFVIIPGGVDDVGHYGYPAASLLAVLFFSALNELLSSRISIFIFLAILTTHLLHFRETVAETNNRLTNYLLPDSTVTIDELRELESSIAKFKIGKGSEAFDLINTKQEIDMSGTWFYSRQKGFGTAIGPYYPTQGIGRVLAWPQKGLTLSFSANIHIKE
jgi:hypothetical protein